jgi:hypothetical protein
VSNVAPRKRLHAMLLRRRIEQIVPPMAVEVTRGLLAQVADDELGGEASVG